MFLDFIPGAFLNIQHQVSSIQHRESLWFNEESDFMLDCDKVQ